MNAKEFVNLISELVADQWYLDLIYGYKANDIVKEIDIDLKYSKIKSPKGRRNQKCQI